ncbi:LytTR family transcriptional regulator DNA-binding domain-containing protein [Alteribacillus bidgolensis]|uniref:LytTr DNA-binding domain-containing protein n=1 Tax=Alteribacillus bidgolensis TaxID=930129 RepID=A0A1G8S1F4_9BACI|nr:LytTR family transcriptional regulator DNA-binding domain-containing protein [Alteribacillus bidgolensis]SDJ23094.1 LytTr DNA-binding domain-containing protein [Alteribacillus bidgolensis]
MAQVVKEKENLIIYKKSQIYKVNVNNIIMIERSQKGIIIYLENKEEVKLRYSLNKMKDHLPGSFKRTHQSFIVNTKYIFKIERLGPSLFQSTLSNRVIALISKEHLKSLLEG